MRGDRLTVEDLGSANGTWVDGTPITTVTQLTEGDEVSLGGFVALRVKILGGTTAPSIPTFTDAGVTISMWRPAPAGGQQPLDMPADWRPAPSDPVPSDIVPKAAPSPAQVQPPVAPPVLAPASDASGNQTVAAPRGPTVAPPRPAECRPADERPAPPAVHPERSRLAPREAAVAPRMDESGAPATKESLTMRPPREAASGVPGSIADRARAARQGVNPTVAAPSGRSQVTPPTEPVVPRRQDGGSIVGVTLEGPTRVTLNLGTFRIGRQTDADVVVESRDVGRSHALLHVEAGGVSSRLFRRPTGRSLTGWR